MARDGKVVFEIQGDARGINSTLKDITNNIQSESKKWDDAADKSTGNITDMFKGMAKGIAGAISAAGITKLLLDIGTASISAASDLAEVQNVVDVTFGESAKEIDAWAQSAGKQFGLTETAAKRYASTIGAMLKSQDVAQDEVLDMSESLAGLAADMASFYNLDFDTAFEKIRSGISGETMPLKQLGINMSVANLEAFALEKGIKKTYSAMSQGEQTLLRYQYLMKATADAQGDFARTSDGFANASRRVASAWEAIETKIGNVLMKVVEPLTNDLADMLETLAESPKRTVLDDFAEISQDTAAKMSDLQRTYDKASDLVAVMRDLESVTVSLGNGRFVGMATLFQEIASIESNGGNARDYLSGLGLGVDAIYQKYQVWNESVKQLTSSIPSLNAVINEQTGAIDGGTAAIQTNLDAWKAAEEQKLAWSAYYAKARALEEKKAEMYSYELDAGAAEQAIKRQRATLDELRKQMGKPEGFDGYIVHGNITATYSAEEKAWNDAVDKLHEYEAEYEKAANEYKRQSDAFADADQQLADAKQYLIDLYGEEADAADYAANAVTDYGNTSSEAFQKTAQAAKTSLKALADYVQGVYDSTAKSVDGVVKGFAVLERPTTALEEKRSKLIEQQNALNRSTKDGAKRYNELQNQINDLNKSLDAYSPKGMKNSLKSQLAFMDEYLSNLEKAQKMGLSNDLLASLSDGSVQSAEYLSTLVNNPKQAAEVDALFQKVQEKKKTLTDALTEQKLTVDDTYKGMVETAKTAVADMHMGTEASEATAETVQGMIDGLKSKMPALSDEIDAILSELSRLSGFGISFDINAVSSSIGGALLGNNNTTITPHETGLDYVPFDGYLAALHEGESILTAEENRVWQRFKNGAQPQSMDYDALGATMRENVQAGGNVYLDGKTVGRVISDQQGNAYRQLTRSGWQQ